MGFLDGLIDSVVGAGLASVVNDVIEQHDGVQGIVNRLEQNGLGETVKT